MTYKGEGSHKTWSGSLLSGWVCRFVSQASVEERRTEWVHERKLRSPFTNLKQQNKTNPMSSGWLTSQELQPPYSEHCIRLTPEELQPPYSELWIWPTPEELQPPYCDIWSSSWRYLSSPLPSKAFLSLLDLLRNTFLTTALTVTLHNPRTQYLIFWKTKHTQKSGKTVFFKSNNTKRRTRSLSPDCCFHKKGEVFFLCLYLSVSFFLSLFYIFVLLIAIVTVAFASLLDKEVYLENWQVLTVLCCLF